MPRLLRARNIASLLFAIALAAVTLTLTSPGAAAANAGIVATQDGLLQGSTPDANGVTAFEGVPYAAPPVGALRWKSPQPAVPWSGVRQASAFGPACYGSQTPGSPAQPMSEDCLTLNIWAPPHAGPARAVMVWLPGGGFQFGSGSQPLYNGANLAARGEIVVTINYRLGVFGYLARTDLDQESGSSGDYGLQDQITALRWVQRNIGAFGGNPGNVTLFGQSAGAHSVGMLMTSPQTHGLFAKAIAQSGAFFDTVFGSIPPHVVAVQQGQALSATLKAPTLADLRAIPAATLNSDAMSSPVPFAPSIDGQVLTDSPAAVFERGQQAHVPLLAGYTSSEGFPVFASLALPHATPAQFDAAAEGLFGAINMPRFEQLYPATNEAQATTSADQLVGDMMIAEQTWEMLGDQQRTGNSAVYGYKFTYTSPYSPMPAHVAEVPFVFGNLIPQYFAPTAPPPTAADQAFSRTLMSYWTNFAESGNPNGAGLTNWPRYQGSGSQLLDLSAQPATVQDPDAARFNFIESFRVNGRFPASWATLG